MSGRGAILQCVVDNELEKTLDSNQALTRGPAHPDRRCQRWDSELELPSDGADFYRVDEPVKCCLANRAGVERCLVTVWFQHRYVLHPDVDQRSPEASLGRLWMGDVAALHCG